MFDRFSWTRNKIEELTRDKPEAQIVDIGCNECPITREMTNCTWVDCESYETIVDLIRKRPVLLYTKDQTTGKFSTIHPELGGVPPIPREKFVQANAESLPFEYKQFDVAIATQLLAYPKNPVAILKEIKRIAKRAIITVRNEKDWDPRYRTSSPVNMRFYTEDMLRQHLEEAEIDNYSFERLDYKGWSFFAVVTGSKVRARFIGGIGGCGGMMLCRWLDAHPNVHSFGETGFIPNNWIYALDLNYIRKSRDNSSRRLWGGSLVYNADEWQMINRSFSKLANSRDDLLRDRKRIGDFIDRMFTNLARLNNKGIWVEKTPMNIFFSARLREYFGDEFRIIWIEREPRDNICCIAFTKTWKPNDILGAINYWASNTKEALRSISTMEERLYMRVSYEDFVYNQVAVGKKICEFLQIPWHESLEVPITYDTDIGRYKGEFNLAISKPPQDIPEYWKQFATEKRI